jgi:hypothetical protein
MVGMFGNWSVPKLMEIQVPVRAAVAQRACAGVDWGGGRGDSAPTLLPRGQRQRAARHLLRVQLAPPVVHLAPEAGQSDRALPAEGEQTANGAQVPLQRRLHSGTLLNTLEQGAEPAAQSTPHLVTLFAAKGTSWGLGQGRRGRASLFSSERSHTRTTCRLASSAFWYCSR